MVSSDMPDCEKYNFLSRWFYWKSDLPIYENINNFQNGLIVMGNLLGYEKNKNLVV
jgi:hypothetical protein